MEVEMNHPQIQGEHSEWRDGRYRLYTIADLPFDALPPYSEGGPSMVTTDGWGTSTSSLCRMFSSQSAIEKDDGMLTLSVYPVPYDPTAERHPLDKVKVADKREADRLRYEAGILQFMVYLRDAEKWGLSTD